MRNLLLLVTSVCVATFAVAGERANTNVVSGPSIWTAPVVNSLFAQGFANLGSFDTKFFAFAEKKGATLPEFFASRPYTLERMGEKLVAAGFDAKTFGALPLAGRLEALNAASVAAQADAQRAQAELMALARRTTFDPKNAVAIDLILKEAGRLVYADVMHHDKQDTLELLSLIEQVRVFKQKRADSLLRKIALIPAKVAAGKFDGRMIAKRDDGVWTDADDLTTFYPTAAEALETRLARVDAMPDGPWKAELYTNLSHTIADSPQVREALAAEGRDPEVMRGIVLKSWENWGTNVMTPSDPKLAAARKAHALAASTGKTPAAKHVIASLQYYDSLAYRSSRGHPADELWIGKGLLADGSQGGFPSYPQLVASRDAAAARAHKYATRSAIAYIGAMVGAIAFGSFFAAAAVKLLLGLIPMAALIFTFRYIWMRDELSSSRLFGGDADRILKRYQEAAAKSRPASRNKT